MTLMLVLAGFAALTAGTFRQSRRLFGRVAPPNTRLACLILGFALLAGSLVPVFAAPDVPLRLVEWFGLLTVAALAAVLAWWAFERRPPAG